MTSTQSDIALAWCQSFENLDADANVALRAPNCVHTFGPLSLNMPQNMTNDQFKAHVNGLKPILATFPVYPKEVFAQEGSNQVTIWATSEARFREEAKDADAGFDWTYEGEYMFLFFFNEAGDRIERIVEYLDSQKVLEVRPKLARARQNVAAGTQGSF